MTKREFFVLVPLASILSGFAVSCGSESTTDPTSATTLESTAEVSSSVSDPPGTIVSTTSIPSSTTTAAEGSVDEVFARCVARLSLGDLPAQFGEVTTQSDPDELRATVGFLALQVFDSNSDPLLSIVFGAEHPMTSPTPVDAAPGFSASAGNFEEGGRVVVIQSDAVEDPCLPLSLISYRLTETEVRQLALTTSLSEP